MANIEVKKVEEQPGRRLLYSVHVQSDAGRTEFPIGVDDQGSAAANEAAVISSTLGFAEELAASARLRLGVRSRISE